MPRQKGVSQVELLRRRHAELADQLKAAEAKERERERQLENRRAQILGAIVVEYLKEAGDSQLAKTLFELVARKLTRPADRALFPNLPTTPPTITASETPPSAMQDDVPVNG